MPRHTTLQESDTSASMSKMDSSTDNGPDASSLAPVSSLRARFEGINKSSDAVAAAQPLQRSISPAPKPEKLREFKPVTSGVVQNNVPPTPTIPARPKPRAHCSTEGQEKAPPPAPPSSKPPVAVRPSDGQSLHAPSLTVQPPQSPPKSSAPTFTPNDQSPYLNPDAIASHTSGNAAPARPRTPTPVLPLPRSPRPNGSQPPSPPPPRRSGEIRRQNETKPLGIPTRRPSLQPTKQMSSSTSPILKPRSRLEAEGEPSPFGSSPSSNESTESETPPLPLNRPRPKSYAPQATTSNRSSGQFEPPPTHHAIAARREREREGLQTGPTGGQITPQVTGDRRPALPARPSKSENRPYAADPKIAPRPLPLKEATNSPTPSQGAAQSPLPAKRAPSNPTPKSQPSPQTQTHGRSKTLDHRVIDRAIPDTTEPATRSHVVVAGNATTTSTIPAGVASTAKSEAGGSIVSYPDGQNSNRRPPFVKKGCYEISTKYNPRIFDVCGEYLCTSGHMTRLWSTSDGELLMSLAHTEGIKATAVSFKPAVAPQDEGKYIWIGLNSGELMEVELATQQITTSRPHIHNRYEVIKIYRHFDELWTLDEAGTLLIWGPGADGVPDITGAPTQTYKVPKSHTFSMVIGNELWHATGKEIRVFLPTKEGRTQFQVLIRPLVAEGAGEVTSGTLLKSHPNEVFFGHADGKISVYSISEHTFLRVINVSTWKINALAGVGNNIWAAYNLGKICIYDIDQEPWVVLKEWQAHENPIVGMKVDSGSAYHLGKVNVASLGADDKVKMWDGLLQDDWMEEEMKSRDTQYCDFEEIRALVLTWNAGAATPHSLRYSGNDGSFFQNLLQSSGSPEILVFGFQELVDLEDKTATAKRFFKTKKKEGPDQEQKMSHQYRDWRDFLMKSLDDYMPADDLYYLLHSAPLVGLFTCVFVKASLRQRIRNLHAAEIKRGMGGLHGNKGAVAIRFQIDDTSLCFVNCHLAAGQTQANARHNDIAAILESNVFPSEREAESRLDSYCGGGDGTLIPDHELCIVNGDLNYRIDTMSRDTVVMAVKQQNLGKLLERDQLLVARRRNPAFRLRAFEELPITFAPTYKYDVGTDNYDSSEKRRSPAWCDRLLFRGRGRVQQLDYQRHEIRVSDHRPVSGNFRMWVKKVDSRGRATAWSECVQGFQDVWQAEVADEKLRYLMYHCGYDEQSSRKHLQDLSKRERSRSRTREAA